VYEKANLLVSVPYSVSFHVALSWKLLFQRKSRLTPESSVSITMDTNFSEQMKCSNCSGQVGCGRDLPQYSMFKAEDSNSVNSFSISYIIWSWSRTKEEIYRQSYFINKKALPLHCIQVIAWIESLICMLFITSTTKGEGGYVFTPFCLFVCLSVFRISQKCNGPDMFSWIRNCVAEVCAPPSALRVVIITLCYSIYQCWGYFIFLL